MKLGLIAPVDVRRDRRFFSGVGYELHRVLADRVAVVLLTVPLRRPPLPVRLYWHTRRRFTRQRYNLDLHPWTVHRQSTQAMRQAAEAGVDVVLAIGQATLASWYAPIPAAFFSDTLYGAKFDTYGPWQLSRMDPVQLQQLQEIGQKAIDNAVAVFVTSRYAFQRAAEFGNITPPDKQVVTYVGPNFVPPDTLPAPSAFPPLRLLWVGGSWERKGGADCVAVADALLAAGVPLELHIVGRKPEDVTRPYLTFHGYLRKNITAECEQLAHLYQTCHFLILPTRGDLGPVGLADAAAMGLPAVTTNVGGIPDFFPAGEAILIPPEQFGTAAPVAIQQAIDNGALVSMRHKARERYAAALNWDAVADKIVHKLEKVLAA
jgi:glycosyltransferase involved in cell wall biosynthesis